MGIFDIFKKKNINKRDNNTITTDNKEKNFYDWINDILKQEIGDEVIALNFNIYTDSDDKFCLELLGSSKYDSTDVKWDIQLSKKDNPYVLVCQPDEIDTMDNLVAGMVSHYIYSGNYSEKLKNYHIICCTFNDDINMIYNNEKYRNIIDYKSINVKTIEEVFSFIKDNNVIYLKKMMYEDFKYKINGYVKKTFEKNYTELINKNVIRDLNDIAYENSTMAPGAIISRFGYIVINTTGGGNAICMDLNSSLDNPRIVFADHSIFCEETPYIRNYYEYKVWKKNLIDKNVKLVRSTLEEYIKDVKDGSLDIEDLDLE